MTYHESQGDPMDSGQRDHSDPRVTSQAATGARTDTTSTAIDSPSSHLLVAAWATTPDGGRRDDRATPPERDHGSLPSEPVAPVAPPLPQYCFNGNEYGTRFYLHRTLHRLGIAYRACCEQLAYQLPARVKPTSSWLEPCSGCFPDDGPMDSAGA